MKAIVLDFEATDATEDAQATEIGIMGVDFYNGILDKSDDKKDVTSRRCKPDRPISYGAMAVTNIFNEDVASCESHIDVCQRLIPKGAAYIIGHNIDFDIRVAANAGVNISQYKAICTLAMARNLYPDTDSHTLGAMSCMLDYEYARANMKDAHGAAADVVMTARLLYIICKNKNITSMEQLYEFSEFARIPTHFPFGKHNGKAIKEVACHPKDREYFDWVFDNIKDKPYLIKACRQAVDNIKLLNWRHERGGLPAIAEIDNGDSYHICSRPDAPAPYIAIKKAGGQVVDDGYFDNTNDAKAWCNKHFNIGVFTHD